MTWRLAQIYRHPVKSLGEEAMDAVALEAGKPMPFDRAWAVAHGGSAWDPAAPGWLNCHEFVTQRNVAAMAQTSIVYDEATGLLTLGHPDRPDLSVRPDDDGAALTAWLAPLAAGRQNGPYALAAAPNVAFTDGDDCHLSLGSLASLKDLEQRVGQPLAPIRFRLNLWLDGPSAWEELSLEGREIEIGAVVLKFLHPCERCNATNANPETGSFDTQIPPLLRKTFGHMDFGINAQVVRGGTINRGDAARLI